LSFLLPLFVSPFRRRRPGTNMTEGSAKLCSAGDIYRLAFITEAMYRRVCDSELNSL